MPRDLRRLLISIDRALLVFLIFSCSIPGLLSSSKIITLDSIQIFTTHEWLPIKPKVYFQCQGENKASLPDVKRTGLMYTFNGEESWQPLTELPDKKCKRCGFYEQDTLKSADVFDEWELCPGDFVEGIYTRLKEHEFNATFICLECRESTGGDQIHISNHENTTESTETKESTESAETKESTENTETKESTESIDTKESTDTKESMESAESPESTETMETTESKETKESKETTDEGTEKKVNIITVILVIGSIALVVVVTSASYKFWQKHKRQRDQARFLKLFDESDDFEDELSLGDVI